MIVAGPLFLYSSIAKAADTEAQGSVDTKWSMTIDDNREPPLDPLLAQLAHRLPPLPSSAHTMQQQQQQQQQKPGGSGDSPSASTSRESASYSRRRAVTACYVCRARKTKCDNQRPICGFCSSTGGACGYPDDTPSDHSKLDRGSLAILQRIGEMERNLTELIIGGRGTMAAVTAPDPGQPFYGPSDAFISLDEAAAAQAVQVAAMPGDRPPTADVVMRSSEMRVESILRWPIFLQVGGPYPSLAATLGQDEAHMPFVTSESIYDLDSDVISQLVENFLATNHVKNPIFVVDQLWARVRDICETGLRWDGATCLVLLICAISVLSPPYILELQPGYSQQPDRLKRAEHYFQMAQRRIGMLYHSNTLLSVQCCFLTAVYLMSTFRIMAAWKSFSQAGMQCVGWLASHRRASNDQAGIALAVCADSEQHMEESLYWSCLKSELELRTELGLPGSTLNDMQYSHVYPSPPSPSQLMAGHATDGAAAVRLETSWFFYLAEIALRRIMNEALSTRYGAGSWYYTTQWWRTADEGWFRNHVERFRLQLDGWTEMLPAPMQFPRSSTEGTGDPLRGILRGHLVDIVDVLYFPAVLAVACQPGPLGTYVLEAAAEALRNAVYRITICEEGFWYRHQGTWLMIRTCSRSLLQLLAVALRVRDAAAVADEPRLVTLLPDGWRHAASRMLTLLAYWEHESADLHVLRTRFEILLAQLGEPEWQTGTPGA